MWWYLGAGSEAALAYFCMFIYITQVYKVNAIFLTYHMANEDRKKLVLSVDSKVHATSLDDVKDHIAWHSTSMYFTLDAGQEHYKLLAYIASQVPPGLTVIDIGSATGASALALASNKNIRVITFDILDFIPKHGKTIRQVENIDYRIQDCNKVDMAIFLDAPVIVLDIDPHDGKQEKTFVEQLIKHNYTGIVICDDIHLNMGMREFWKWVSLKKLDVTAFGHVTGTGVIVFNPSVVDVVLQ